MKKCTAVGRFTWFPGLNKTVVLGSQIADMLLLQGNFYCGLTLLLLINIARKTNLHYMHFLVFFFSFFNACIELGASCDSRSEMY